MLKSKGPVHFLRPDHRVTACGLKAKPGSRTTGTADKATCGNCRKFMAVLPVLTREEIAALTEPDPRVNVADFAAMEAQVNTVVAKAREVLNDHAPPGYDAHHDILADAYDHAEAVNKLAKALRELLEAVTP